MWACFSVGRIGGRGSGGQSADLQPGGGVGTSSSSGQEPGQSQGPQWVSSCCPLLSQEGSRQALNLPCHSDPPNNYRSYHLWGEWLSGSPMCACSGTLVMPGSLDGSAPGSPLCPLDSPGKNTGLGCHALPQGIFPDPGIEPRSPPSPASAGRCFILSPPGKPINES